MVFAGISGLVHSPDEFLLLLRWGIVCGLKNYENRLNRGREELTAS